jgi:dihydrofolate reductase
MQRAAGAMVEIEFDQSRLWFKMAPLLLHYPAKHKMADTRITLVVAMDRARGIGVANRLPWHLPEDLAHFKRVTSGHTIIMGRKTFDSIGRPLPNRRNVVITRDCAWRRDGVDAATSLAAALTLAQGADEAFVIGGAEIFRLALPAASRMIITEIDARFDCDTFFPAFDDSRWQTAARERYHSAASDLEYAIADYRRIAPD